MGFDPSLRNWGMASGVLTPDDDIIIAELELIQPNVSKGKTVRQNSKDLEAAQQLYAGASEFIKRHDPRVLFVEVPHGAQSARAMASYAICIGVLSAIQEEHMPFIQLTETEVKVGSIGDKKATKQEMIDWAFARHPDLNWPITKRDGEKKITVSKAEHLADAVATIEAGVSLPRFKQLRKMAA